MVEIADMGTSNVERNRALFASLKWPVIAYGLFAAGYTAYLPGKIIWYSFHPFFMIIGFVPLLINAVLLKKIGGYDNTKLHGILLTVSTLCAGFAFYVIFSNKSTYNKPHFTTTHGQGGIAILIMYLALAIVGFIGLNPDWGVVRTNKQIRFIHKWLGKAVASLTWLSCIFQFIKVCPNVYAQIAFVLPLAIFGFFAVV